MTDTARAAAACDTLDALNAVVTECRACPRLVAWREQVARERRAAFAHEEYWGRPVPGFGDPRARILVVGLAPAAHGANRTGRMFTGDRSGDWLYRSLHATGFASQPTSTSREDGLTLRGAWITAAARCAPPANKPTTDELARCRSYIARDIELLAPTLSVFVCLGGIAYNALWRILSSSDVVLPRPKPAFGHGVEIPLGDGRSIICSYHPSQQNTFTGRLTEPMLDSVFTRARTLAGIDG